MLFHVVLRRLALLLHAVACCRAPSCAVLRCCCVLLRAALRRLAPSCAILRRLALLLLAVACCLAWSCAVLRCCCVLLRAAWPFFRCQVPLYQGFVLQRSGVQDRPRFPPGCSRSLARSPQSLPAHCSCAALLLLLLLLHLLGIASLLGSLF